MIVTGRNRAQAKCRVAFRHPYSSLFQAIPHPLSYDVVIIGAGAAGLAAAAELARSGRSALVLEARERIGGRVWSLDVPGLPVPVELGAEFIHGRPQATLSLLQEAGIPAVDSTRTQLIAFDGKLRPVNMFTQAQRVARKPVKGRDTSFRAFLARQRTWIGLARCVKRPLPSSRRATNAIICWSSLYAVACTSATTPEGAAAAMALE